MSDIGIKISSDIQKESVLINPKIRPSDKVIKKRDENGKVISAEVHETKNIISRGNSAKQAASQVYGKRF